jgi:hypothetical protein
MKVSEPTTMKTAATKKKTKAAMTMMMQHQQHPHQSYHVVDLKLDHRLKPTPYETFLGDGQPSTAKLISENLMANDPKEHTFYAIGSDDATFGSSAAPKDATSLHFRHGDLGLFSAVYEAWKNHWTLRTTPEDWWFPVACRISKAIDTAAQQEMHHDFVRIENPVRELFVNHKGKETIVVALDSYTIFDANYDDAFSGFSSKLTEKIKVPGYVPAMENNFSTSDSTHLIASQINMMSSLQQFFEYEMCLMGCGLRGLEMNGTVDDWSALRTKLRTVKDILKPIKNSLRTLYASWWEEVDRVFEMLEVTRATPDDPRVAKFWINILCDTTDTKYVGGGGSLPGRPVEVKAYDGWLIKFLLDEEKILAEDLQDSKSDVRKQLSGYNTVPLQVKYTWCTPFVDDETTLLAGIVGYKVYYDESATAEGTGLPSPAVEPHHMWGMMTKVDSPLLMGGSKKKE